VFKSLPKYLKEQKLNGDVRVLLQLKKGLERGLVHTIGDLYGLLKGLITNSPKDIGPFTVAFYQYFLDISIRPGESLDAAIMRSETFKTWRRKRLEDNPDVEEPDVRQLVDEFLNEVHLTTYDIQNLLNGADIFNEDNPDMPDTDGEDQEEGERHLDRAADYSDLSLEELMERMRKVLEQQRRRHSGGAHWLGTGGISPYGHGGAAKGGIRVGGAGGGKMARRVLGDKNFYPVDTKSTLSDDNIDVALSFLKGIQDESLDPYLDVPKTIKEGVKEGGLFLPKQSEKIEQKVQVLLLIDNGGWSMSPYVASVKKLFSKMKRRFAHDLKTYYFHNTIYGGAYHNPARFESAFDDLEKICKLDKRYAVFIVGDADMAPYELSKHSIQDWQAIRNHFTRVVWLNPLDQRFWSSSYTVVALHKIFEMFPLSPDGIEQGVLYMNRRRREK